MHNQSFEHLTWNVCEIHGIDISQCSSPSKIVFTSAEQHLKQGYIIVSDNYYSSPELFSLLTDFIQMQ
jgi:hypothetical protein